MLLTLLLTENTPIAFAAFFFLIPLVLGLSFPVFFLSRPKSSSTAVAVALGLALLLLWPAKAFGQELGGLARTLFYLPLGIVFVNLARKVYKEEIKN